MGIALLYHRVKKIKTLYKNKMENKKTNKTTKINNTLVIEYASGNLYIEQEDKKDSVLIVRDENKKVLGVLCGTDILETVRDNK